MCRIEQFLRLLPGIIDEVGLVNVVMVNGGAAAIRPSRPLHFTVLSMSLSGRTHTGSVFFRAHPLSGDWLTTEGYDRPYVAELEHVMSASSCAYPCHDIGILMSSAGRFVSCIHWHLSFRFPAGADYDTVVKPCEYHSCSVPILWNQDAARGEHSLRLTKE
jgi:hypothetical protein